MKELKKYVLFIKFDHKTSYKFICLFWKTKIRNELTDLNKKKEFFITEYENNVSNNLFK